MRYFCNLYIKSDTKNTPANIFEPAVIRMLEFYDRESAIGLATTERLRKTFEHWPSDQKGRRPIIRSDLPRYFWTLSSQKAVSTDEDDPYIHVSWLLSRLKGVLVSDLIEQGIECKLSFYWGGLGTGGGPLIAPRLSELLHKHQVYLGIGFYPL